MSIISIHKYLEFNTGVSEILNTFQGFPMISEQHVKVSREILHSFVYSLTQQICGEDLEYTEFRNRCLAYKDEDDAVLGMLWSRGGDSP